VPLVVCATPIGNLEDVTLRVLAALRDADAVLCEDTRRTQILLDRHGIRARALDSLHRHNEARRVAELVPRLASGETHALVSDAGLPGVNDPGARLVRAAIAAGLDVTVLPGPSAVETALVASGLVSGQYRFLGYLPRRAAELRSLWESAREWPYAAVAFESPRRLPGSLAALAEIEPERPVAVCRELTKRFEEIVRAELGEEAGVVGAALIAFDAVA
jgi:16S rRNA (cytidine1402-2'-O)-methyltransferase